MAKKRSNSIRRVVALATATLLTIGGLTVVAPTAASAAPLSIESAKVLDLRFDGALTDAGPNAAAVTMQKGTAAYGAGVRGEAFNLNGTNAIRLGTAAYLQPADLTASFWFKPNATMTGEQVFAWSKVAYNTQGWYLTSEGDGSPLALSIGPASGQPYKVAVDTPRAGFFPVGKWTHIVVTYDKATKAVTFYRNGVRQVSTVKYAATGTATGLIAGESTSVKTLGYNGPQYNGAHANGLLDDYTLYNGVATMQDVVALTQQGDPAFDPAAVAQSALDALAIPATAAADFGLPTDTVNGTAITWASSDTDVISIDGGAASVTRPASGPATVTLTATATYAGSAPVTRTFSVEVPQDGATTSIYVEETELSEVLLEDPYLVNGNEKMVAYLLSLDPERFLNAFYTQAGLPVTAQPYGGWERTSGTRFQGHFFGHYMSALSQAYATSTDPAIKAQLLAKLTTAVDGLDRAQKAYALKDPTNAGYVAPFATSVLPSGGGGLLVPFYNLHKVLAGLLDAHQQAPEAVADKALTVASGFGTWVRDWAGRQSNPAGILNTEYGGMNEALYELFSITENPVHKRAAEYFDETTLFQQLAAGQDVLNGKHANTTIPKLVGALKRYTVFTDNPHLYETLTAAEKSNLGMYRTAAENFWQMVVDDHTYANGGNSQSEHFHGADTLHQHATNGTTSGYGENSTSEICNEYNMLKLTKALFQVQPDVKYPDFYEHTYINAILAQQNPETGMMTYFQPMQAGYAKVFGNPVDEFWCDHGTATESFTKLGDSIYFRKGSSVYVNMFRSSVYTDDAHNLRLTQTADVPADDTVTYSVEAIDGGELVEGTTLRLRIPSWAAATPTLTVNGAAQDVAALTQDGYIALEIEAGDELTYLLPAEVRVDDSTENPNWVAFTYGPVLLATELNRTNVGATYVAGVLVRMSTADKTVSNDVVVDDAEAFKDGIAENLVRIEDGENLNGISTMRFKMQNADAASEALTFEPWYSLYNARYAIYMDLIEPDSPQAQALILKGKQQQRVEETTIDSLTSFDNNNSEADKNYKYNKSGVGVWLGEGYRDGQIATDAYFQYDMIVDPTLPKNHLGVRYFGGDNGRTFDVYINDVLLKHERVTNANGSTSFYVQYDEIPAAVLAGIPAKDSYKRNQNGEYVLDEAGEKIPVVTVRFQGNGTSYVGGVFGVYTTSGTTYGTDADLTALSFEDGRVAPTLTDGVYSYTVTVDQDATTATFDADPAVPSGLVYLGDVLIDDTLPRTVPLAAGTAPTVLTLKATAQDHTTTATYRLEIVRAPATPSLEVTGVAAMRCVAGKVVLTVQASNRSAVPVALAVTTPLGSKQVAALAPGKSTSAAFTSRVAHVAAGTASITASAVVDGAPATVTVPVAFPALSCG
ncbi:beta-L-arabinofuranosidase domain-containing protein [Microbacterium sp. CFBP9034]|uniref:beta-L-arabinofuranosidase domain-containing protein n=1 Tax=Microbacterium sp. CFBP9034 TaxID=3096540 RepID=UPI002A6A032E|nr:beta-L-arabinofuranosidase domain-containing protein [Microbacterium sp. CFBP9034]MDY0908614.1 glycoside hydrolase family 127 protein [Microbacterium sp. CFBP9034]